MCSKDLTEYSDFMLQNTQALQRCLFIATVENPTQTRHHTGLFLYLRYHYICVISISVRVWYFGALERRYIKLNVFGKIASIQFYFKGLSKECLDVLFQFLKTKAKSLRMWNGLARMKKKEAPGEKDVKTVFKGINLSFYESIYPLRFHW